MGEFKVGDNVRVVSDNGAMKGWNGYVCDAGGGIFCVDFGGLRWWFVGNEIEASE